MRKSPRKKYKRHAKYGAVTLIAKGGRFIARYTDPSTRADVRRYLKAATELEAVEECVKLAKAIEAGTTTAAARQQANAKPAVRSALTEAVKAMHNGHLSNVRCLRGVNAFLKFLSSRYAHVQTWADVRPSMIAEWVHSMKERGLAFDTIRLSLYPIRRASAYWAAEEPDAYRDVARLAKVKLERSLPKPVEVLTARELVHFLDWLKANAPDVWPMACLSGLAGLRMLEAGYLRHCDVDWQAGTVSIAKTDLHTPKNRGSYRTIPVHEDVLKAVRAYLEACKVQEASSAAPVFLSTRGRAWSFHGLMDRWRDVMTEARKAKTVPAGFKAHGLRATFATIARHGKADVRYLQRYLGHTAKDVLGLHYEAIGIEDLRGGIAVVFARQLAIEIGNVEAKFKEISAQA